MKRTQGVALEKGLSQVVSGSVEAVVLFGTAFDGSGFDSVGTVRHRVVGNPLQEQASDGDGVGGAVVEPFGSTLGGGETGDGLGCGGFVWPALRG